MNLETIYSSKKSGLTPVLYFAAFIFAYIILFEFLLPSGILPPPSLLPASFLSLWNDYDLFMHFLYTVSDVYIALAAGYVCVFLLRSFIIQAAYKNTDIAKAFSPFVYFPIIFFVGIFIYWLPENNAYEYLFTFVVSLFLAAKKLYTESTKINREYIEAALSMKIPQTKIYSDVIWKASQPEVFNEMKNIHLYIFNILIFFEFIRGSYGIGSLYKLTFLYNDFSGFLIVSIFLAVIFYIGNLAIEALKNKLINWEK
jgi:ABC-type nitrate/sulfonate/bicarbonate transport system permease component